jgi:hypothetical protein
VKPLKVGDMPPWPRMSEEVMLHHVRQHPCRGDWPVDMLTCPCGDSKLLTCGECDEMVLLFLCPDRPVCVHAGPILEQQVTL